LEGRLRRKEILVGEDRRWFLDGENPCLYIDLGTLADAKKNKKIKIRRSKHVCSFAYEIKFNKIHGT